MATLKLPYRLGSTTGKQLLSKHRRSQQHLQELHVLERLLLNESKQPSAARLAVDQVGDSKTFVSEVIAIDNRYKAGTLTIDADGAGATLVVTGRNVDNKAHTVALVNPAANSQPLSQTVTFNAATGVAAIVISLATDGGGSITSTVENVRDELNRGVAGTLVSAAYGTATGAETAVAVGAAPLASLTATATSATSKWFGYSALASKAIRASALVQSAAGADGSTLAIVNAADADAAIANSITIDMADNATVKAGTIAATGALAAGAIPKATLTAAAGANVSVAALLEIQRTGAGSYVVTVLDLDAGYQMLGLDVACDLVSGTGDVTVAAAVAGTAAISTLTITSADSGTVKAATLATTTEFHSGGALKATVTVPAGVSVELGFIPKIALIGDSNITLS